MSFPAFFDTNVLYGALLNDFILELADSGLFRPLWSKDVLFELAKNLVKNGEDPALVEKRVGTMERYFADALVTGYDDLVPTMTNDKKDRHVLAAAVRGSAEVLVTFNVKDFPTSPSSRSTSRSSTPTPSFWISSICTTRRRYAPWLNSSKATTLRR
ncbi:PIN domain-containing protein [Herbiconiux sp. CPCC 203407]|uniref:PIN domain-containing protein n=1 Tax=Herbiconiux oxytropis TaxID=2970915 RepID=A0AA41XAF4_9MICO|nr:PIN domain-containing protein [Herbiconiux oxytropis]MCS5721514.1 PIN domain-containing protein [Herbiconiux oxytropis]MCS5724591.1 PIN domain-containing protein [Herbiconiux oxytropis]